MDEIRTDLCVIGAGSGGLSVAAGAVQMGARVVLIEAAEMGGDCLNHGCVPSKALIAAAKAAHAMTTGERFGIRPVTPEVDFAAVKDHVARVIATIAPIDSQDRFEGLGVRVIRAHARFVAPDVVEAGGQRIRARRFVIATGSRPRVPPIPGLADGPFLTNETIFPLRERPQHLLILGGGPIGIELAQAHRRLGCRVTVLDGGAALQKEDPELAQVVLSALRNEGVEIVTKAKVARVDWSDGVTLHLEDGRSFGGSHLLVATGRAVTFDGMGLAAANVAHDDKGVTVDARLRSTNRRIFAVGDAAGQGQFTHLAGYHAGIVIRQAVLGLPARARTDHIPRVTYADPELAQVGLTEAEARKAHGAGVTILPWPFHDNDRAQAEGRTEGLVKLVTVKGRIVGAGIVGPQAGELIGLWALALSSGIKLSAVAGMVLPYPTLSEVSKRAAGAYFSPKLFDNPALRRVVWLVQHVLP
ncbi:FAD-dependent oxidoreductase [Tabrizicola sp. J26]|uniref:dihydrolipoyl dehydrogenase family protein n=1 Tax=Alitabrizicola rongguiensis TaxID=2909234 RepID=UPI001F3DADC1|nr:FAD-dependent oxidoreductase [Tabrizicola rongguiensis]MCF1707564.1 FAD-dependent oxidoreductase [Tabrizicola rongguiensis]